MSKCKDCNRYSTCPYHKALLDRILLAAIKTIKNEDKFDIYLEDNYNLTSNMSCTD